MTETFTRPSWPAPDHVRALQTTRHGGDSRGAWRSFNLGAHCGDDPDTVAANRALLAAELPGPVAWPSQVHGTRVLRHGDCADAAPEGDAVVASRPGEVCAVLTADCLPVLMTDRDGREVAVAHAGWRGLAAGVLEATVNALAAGPEELLAWLGPAIGPDHYEVGEDVRDAFMRVDVNADAAFVRTRDAWHADLFTLARQRLARAGLPPARVYGGGVCTACDAERYYSYRRDGVTGRMASLVWIEPD